MIQQELPDYPGWARKGDTYTTGQRVGIGTRDVPVSIRHRILFWWTRRRSAVMTVPVTEAMDAAPPGVPPDGYEWEPSFRGSGMAWRLVCKA